MEDNTMKKVLCLLLSALFMMSFAACGETNDMELVTAR